MSVQQQPDETYGELKSQLQTGMTGAAEMLCRLLPEGRFELDLNPELEIAVPAADDQELAGICLPITGAINGSLLLLMEVAAAERLAGLLLRQAPPFDLGDDRLRSSLREVGNIFASSVLANLDESLQLRALPEPPTLFFGTRSQLQRQCPSCRERGSLFRIEAGFDCSVAAEQSITGLILFQVAQV